MGKVISESPDVANELLLEDDQGTRLRYQVTKEGVVRFLVDGGKTMARDDFRLPDCHISLTAGDESDSMFRTLTIERPMATITRNSRAPKPLRSLKIQAQLNRQQPAIPRNQVVVSDPTGNGSTEDSK
jgi:hypothetical protein